MKISFSIVLILTVFVGLSDQQSSITNNIVFDLADLTIDYETNFGWITLEAYKSSLNDLIIEKKEVEKFSQLNWLSIGYPNLVKMYNKSNIYQLFTFKPEGFDVNVEMLTTTQRNLFKDLVKTKYNIDINPTQIISLPLSKFECQIIFYKENNKVIINGQVNQLSRFPLKLSFQAPLKTKERIFFEERINKDREDLDIDLFCEVNSQGKAYRQNTLIITGSQFNQIGLLEEIFGKGSETYVTRDQISRISSKLYLKLNIIEEYQIAETRFKESFIDDFIKQTSQIINQYVSIDQALNGLSKFDVSEDIKPTVIKSEYSKLFYVNKTGSKEFLQLNLTQYEKLNKASSSSVSGSSKGGFGPFSASASASYATSQKSEWEKLGISFSEQLNELNTYTENDIEWSRIGNIVIPKSIRVSRLVRAMFSKDLVFSRVKREYYDAPFKKQFILETRNSFSVPQYVLDNSQKINIIEQKLNGMDKKIDSNNISNSQKNNIIEQKIYEMNSKIENNDILTIQKNIACKNPSKYNFVQRLNTTIFYTVSDFIYTWVEAEDYCKSYGAHLPVVKNSQDTEFLRNFIGERVKKVPTYSPTTFVDNVFVDWEKNTSGYWLGGYFSVKTNSWKWIDDSTFPNWAGANARNSEYVLQDAYFILQNRWYGWNDLPPIFYNQYTICELKC